MPRTAMITSAVALMIAAVPLAYGQSTGDASSSAAPPTSATNERMANHVLPGQMRAAELNGATVYDRDNANLGDIKDIILDKDGHVAEVILNVGSTLGVGGRYVAVGFNDLKITSDGSNTRLHVTINLTKDQLKSAQAFDLTDKSGSTGTSKPPAERDR